MLPFEFSRSFIKLQFFLVESFYAPAIAAVSFSIFSLILCRESVLTGAITINFNF